MQSDGDGTGGTGIWKDERRSPGYLPQGRRAPFAFLALVGFARAFYVVLGVLICLLGILVLFAR